MRNEEPKREYSEPKAERRASKEYAAPSFEKHTPLNEAGAVTYTYYYYYYS